MESGWRVSALFFPYYILTFAVCAGPDFSLARGMTNCWIAAIARTTEKRGRDKIARLQLPTAKTLDPRSGRG